MKEFGPRVYSDNYYGVGTDVAVRPGVYPEGSGKARNLSENEAKDPGGVSKIRNKDLWISLAGGKMKHLESQTRYQ